MKTLNLLKLSTLKTSAIVGGQCECKCMVRNGSQIDFGFTLSKDIPACHGHCHNHGLIMYNCPEIGRIVTDKDTLKNLRRLYVFFLLEDSKKEPL